MIVELMSVLGILIAVDADTVCDFEVDEFVGYITVDADTGFDL